MKKQVIVVKRDNSQVGMRVTYEIQHIHKIDNIDVFTPRSTPEIFFDFKKQFRINVFPVIQIGNSFEFTTIHMDPDHEEFVQGAGSKQNNNLIFVKVNNVEELISKAIELYQK